MKNQISRLLIVAGFVLAFVIGAASRSIPGTAGAVAVAAQEKHEAMQDMRSAQNLLQRAKALLEGAPGSFGGHRDQAIKRVDEALHEVHEAIESREHQNH